MRELEEERRVVSYRFILYEISVRDFGSVFRSSPVEIKNAWTDSVTSFSSLRLHLILSSFLCACIWSKHVQLVDDIKINIKHIIGTFPFYTLVSEMMIRWGMGVLCVK